MNLPEYVGVMPVAERNSIVGGAGRERQLEKRASSKPLLPRDIPKAGDDAFTVTSRSQSESRSFGRLSKLNFKGALLNFT